MILANGYVAEKIQGGFPSAALVRVHAPPEAAKLSALEGVASKMGVSGPGGVGGGPSGGRGARGKGGVPRDGARGVGWGLLVRVGSFRRTHARCSRLDPYIRGGEGGRGRGWGVETTWAKRSRFVGATKSLDCSARHGIGLRVEPALLSPAWSGRRGRWVVIGRRLTRSVGSSDLVALCTLASARLVP